MQNKGFVKVFAVLLTLVCVFYLSFSFVTRYHMDKAAQDPKGEAHYLDSMQNEKVYLGSYTLKQCREMEIGLGLDLKGGMNVILEVSVPDVVKALADNKTDEAFNKAVAEASKQSITSQDDFITLFVKEYKKQAPNGKLAELFATQQLKDKVTTRSSDSEVEKVLREEVKAAMEGMLAPEVKEQITATIEIREVFNITKVGLVAGAMVKTGKVKRSDKARLIRDGIVIFTGAINALKRFKDDVKEVGTNFELSLIHISEPTRH